MKSDNKFTAKCRKLQSDYREEVLKERCGKGPYKNSKDFYGNKLVPFKAVNRKLIIPTEEEIIKNPRARSAKLRIAERLSNG